MAWGVGGPTVGVDVQRAVIDIVKGFEVPSLTVRATYPDDATPAAPALPFAGVMDLGSPAYDAVVEETNIQVSVWADKPTTAKGIAATVRGLLLDSRGAGRVGSILPGVRHAPVRDSDTGYWIAAFTVRVFSRPNGG